MPAILERFPSAPHDRHEQGRDAHRAGCSMAQASDARGRVGRETVASTLAFRTSGAVAHSRGLVGDGVAGRC
jgi:hypothetical protein